MLQSMAVPDGYCSAQPTHASLDPLYSSSYRSIYSALSPADETALDVKIRVGKEIPIPQVKYDPRASMAFDSAKGLLNPSGENNCFLNSAVQVLWHLDAFRRNFRLLKGHFCMGTSCIFCALKVVFDQYQSSCHAALPAALLRDALAESFANQQRYQLGLMDDAAECFENILMRIHVHIAHEVAEDTCQEPHCIPHQKFAMTLIEQAVCDCGETCEPSAFTQIINYVSTYALTNRASRCHDNFGCLLGSAASEADGRKCPMNCGGQMLIRRTLTCTPDVLCIGLVWDSDQPSSKHIDQVVHSIGTVIHPAEMFYSVVDADWAVSTAFNLVGVVCYYGQHYTTFFFHSKMKIWILFDDSRVERLGPDWKRVVEKCCRGRYQPLLLLYANSDCSLIDVSSAPPSIVHMRDGLGFVKRPRDVVRRSLLPPRLAVNSFESLPSTNDQSFSKHLNTNCFSLNNIQQEALIARQQQKNLTCRSNLVAVSEKDEIDERSHKNSLSRTSNCDTSSFSSSSSSLSSSRSNSICELETTTRPVACFQDDLESCCTGPLRDAKRGSEDKRSLLNSGNLWESAAHRHPDYSDSEPYITNYKVREILDRQVKRKTAQHSAVAGIGRSGDYFDSLSSTTSHKDSGHRTNDDRQISTLPSNSQILFVSTSAGPMGSNLAHATLSRGNHVDQSKSNGSGVHSLRSSFENLLSSQTVPKVPPECEKMQRINPSGGSGHLSRTPKSSCGNEQQFHVEKPFNYLGNSNMQQLLYQSNSYQPQKTAVKCETSAHDVVQTSSFSRHEQFNKYAPQAVHQHLNQGTKYEHSYRYVPPSAVTTNQAAMLARPGRSFMPAAQKTSLPSSVVQQCDRAEDQMRSGLTKYTTNILSTSRSNDCNDKVPSYPYRGQTDVAHTNFIAQREHPVDEREQRGAKGRHCGAVLLQPRVFPQTSSRSNGSSALVKKTSDGRGVPAAVIDGLGKPKPKSSSSTSKPNWKV